MIVVLISFLISLGAAAGIYCGLQLYEDIGYIWVPFVGVFLLFFAGLALFMLFLLIVGKIVYNPKKYYDPRPLPVFLVKQTVQMVCFLSNVHIKTNGLEKLPKDTRYFGIFNHSSSYDGLVMLSKIKGMSFVGKKELEKSFCIGPWIPYAGHMLIDRDDMMQSLGIIKRGAYFMKEGKADVIIAPEGTRSKTRELLPYHAMVFEAAKLAKAPIVIYTIQNASAVAHRMPFRPTRVYLDVASVIPFEEYKEMKVADLSEKCRNITLEYLLSHKDRLIENKGIE